MAHHDPEDSAGSQLAMMVALKLILSTYRGNAEATQALETELEAMRALLLSSPADDRKLSAFNEAAKSLLEAIQANG